MCPPIDVKGLKEAPILACSNPWLGRVFAVLVCLASVYTCVVCLISYYIPLFSASPRPTIQESDLVGYWVAWYGGGTRDLLILREDGMFRQGYINPRDEGHTFFTTWLPWTIERFPEGDIYVHLEGGRVNRPGVNLEIVEAWDLPFWDPYRRRSVYMRNELILTVRQAPVSGDIYLEHMCSGRESCYRTYFLRLNFWNWTGIGFW